MTAECSWGHAGHDGSMQTEGSQPSADPGKSAQKRLRSSAFPSSLSWDSDSEKETLDGNTWFFSETCCILIESSTIVFIICSKAISIAGFS